MVWVALSSEIMPKRYNYDLSNYIFQIGRIGRVQTLNVIPVVAGDSISIKLSGIFRSSPLRRSLVVDPRIDIVACFVPHRHIYGALWTSLVRSPNHNFDFPAVSATDRPGIGVGQSRVEGSRYRDMRFWPWVGNVQSLPQWFVEGYYRIWNRYFRPPKQGVSERTYNTYLLSDHDRYGFPAARLPSPLSQFRSQPSNPDGGDADNADVSANKVHLQKFALNSALWGQKLSRQWFVEYYDDVMRQLFGTSANTDVDERPEFLNQSTRWLSGMDQAGTDSGNLGTAFGKSEGPVSFGMPTKFFVEHGAIWILMVVRYPSIYASESHYLINHGSFNYREIMGDPFLWQQEAPRHVPQHDYFIDSTNITLGYEPYGQWYRYQPNVLAKRFSLAASNYEYPHGFPFLDNSKRPTSPLTSALCGYDDYDDIYGSWQLQHWHLSARCNVMAKRIIPPPNVTQGTIA